MFISGDPMQDYVVAIVVPKKGFLPEDGDELRKIIINDIIKIALEHKVTKIIIVLLTPNFNWLHRSHTMKHQKE